jgi:hypothetical protein
LVISTLLRAGHEDKAALAVEDASVERLTALIMDAGAEVIEAVTVLWTVKSVLTRRAVEVAA